MKIFFKIITISLLLLMSGLGMIYSIASGPSYITNSIISLFLSGFSLIATQIAKKQGLINKYIIGSISVCYHVFS